jgi:hypothetical protein
MRNRLVGIKFSHTRTRDLINRTRDLINEQKLIPVSEQSQFTNYERVEV